MTSTQDWDPRRYADHGRFVPELGQPVVELLAPRRGERILDLGCGDGALTEKLVAPGCVVVGVDGSAAQVEVARRRGLDARVVDAHALPFAAEFDAVFSNAALHWMPRQDAVHAGVWRALRPGGRFVAEMGGDGNIATIVAALERALRRRSVDPRTAVPWTFPKPGEYRALLEGQGFVVRSMEYFPRPTRLPGDLMGWLETFAGSFAAAVPEGERAAMLREVCDELRPKLCSSDGVWIADYVRLRFWVEKPGTRSGG
jgi:trans-aconitate methyltransferase